MSSWKASEANGGCNLAPELELLQKWLKSMMS
jgi:hypothetical protein